MESIYTPLIVFLVVVVVLFLIGREIVCWYWKVNEGLELLGEIRDLLKAQVEPQKIELDYHARWGHLDRVALAGMEEEELYKLTQEMGLHFGELPTREKMEAEILRVLRRRAK